ncbi:hypothetical protein [Burkholderia cepacia]|uniref:hypothetical protein n=1 Tax=Burkholderia cepacia TaxID=292 RepID=UPI00398EA13A
MTKLLLVHEAGHYFAAQRRGLSEPFVGTLDCCAAHGTTTATCCSPLRASS